MFQKQLVSGKIFLITFRPPPATSLNLCLFHCFHHLGTPFILSHLFLLEISCNLWCRKIGDWSSHLLLWPQCTWEACNSEEPIMQGSQWQCHWGKGLFPSTNAWVSLYMCSCWGRGGQGAAFVSSEQCGYGTSGFFLMLTFAGTREVVTSSMTRVAFRYILSVSSHCPDILVM